MHFVAMVHTCRALCLGTKRWGHFVKESPQHPLVIHPMLGSKGIFPFLELG